MRRTPILKNALRGRDGGEDPLRHGGQILSKSGKFVTGIKEFENWMQQAHFRLGARYNKRHGMQGKVAYDCPQTSEIENKANLLRVMFYADANPVRAGMVSHPPNIRFRAICFTPAEKSTLAKKP